MRHLAGSRARSAASTTSTVRAVLGEGGAQALEHHAAEGDVRVGDDAARSAPARARTGRRRPSAWSLRSGGGHGSAAARGAVRPWRRRRRAACARRREDQVHLAASRRQAALPPPRSARCTRALRRQAVPVFGHALAVGHADDLQLVADQRVERRAELHRLVDLATARSPRQVRGAVGDQHVLDRLALRRGVDDEQLLDRRCDSMSSSSRVRLSRCAMPAVSISTIFLRRQQVEQVFQRGAVVRGVHRHAEDAAVGAQLLVRADAVGVERDQAEVAGAVLGGEGGGDLGGAGGLADAGGADQRVDAAAVFERGLALSAASRLRSSTLAAQAVSSATSAAGLRPACGSGPARSRSRAASASGAPRPGWRCSFSMKASAPKRSSIRPFIERSSFIRSLAWRGDRRLGRSGLGRGRHAASAAGAGGDRRRRAIGSAVSSCEADSARRVRRGRRTRACRPRAARQAVGGRGGRPARPEPSIGLGGASACARARSPGTTACSSRVASTSCSALLAAERRASGRRAGASAGAAAAHAARSAPTPLRAPSPAPRRRRRWAGSTARRRRRRRPGGPRPGLRARCAAVKRLTFMHAVLR